VLREGKRDVVLDLSFWEKKARDEWRGLVEGQGKGVYEVVLVVCRGTEGVIWRRILGRESSWGRRE